MSVTIQSTTKVPTLVDTVQRTTSYPIPLG